MRETIVAKRYAEGFMAYAKESIGVKKACEEFKALHRVIDDTPEFKTFLLSPSMTFTEKCDFMDDMLKEHFSQDIRHFLKLLIEKSRISLIADIADYIRVHYSRGEAVSALLKSAYPLDLDMITAIKEKLEKKLHKKLNLYLELDGGLGGGVQVTVGNTVIDGSVRRRLEDLRAMLETIRIY